MDLEPGHGHPPEALLTLTLHPAYCRHQISYREMVQRVEEAFPEGMERLCDPKGEVAKNFRIPGFRGSVSFITSMTSNFCGDCNRCP